MREEGREERREGGRESGRESGREGVREGERERGREGGRERGREGGRERGREGEREGGRGMEGTANSHSTVHSSLALPQGLVVVVNTLHHQTRSADEASQLPTGTEDARHPTQLRYGLIIWGIGLKGGAVIIIHLSYRLLYFSLSDMASTYGALV